MQDRELPVTKAGAATDFGSELEPVVPFGPQSSAFHKRRPWGGRPMLSRSAGCCRTKSVRRGKVRDLGEDKRPADRHRLALPFALCVIGLVAGCGRTRHGAPVPVPASVTSRTTQTVVPPHATLAPTVPARDQVVAAAQRFADVARQCAANPGTPCDLSGIAGPPESTAFEQKMADLASRGLRVRLTPTSRLVIDSVNVGDPPTQATLEVCQVDADVVYTPGAGPGGQDVIYNNAVTTYRNTWSFRLDRVGGGHWKLYTSTRTSQASGAACQPAS